MKAEKIDLLALKPNQQTLEFVDPCKGSFVHEAFFVHGFVKMTLAITLCVLAIALIFRNIRSYTAIPEQFTRLFCIKSTICIKIGIRIGEFKLIKLLFIESNPIPVKAAMEIMGLIGPAVRLPLVPMTEGNKAKLKAEMQAVGLI